MATINANNTQLTPLSDFNVLYPLQDAFVAYNQTDDLNITGDGTVFTCDFDTTVVNRQSGFSNPTFTAPSTGLYYITATLFVQGLTTSHTGCSMNITTTANIYACMAVSYLIRDANTNWGSCTASIVAPMTSGDTATVALTVSGGTKVVDINGQANLQTNMSGILIG